MDFNNKVAFEYGSLEEAYPPCDPGIEPLGSRVLVQVRSPKRVTKGGIHLTQETRETELYNSQIAKVVAIGPMAFRRRDTGEPWPEGRWFEVGDYVRCPKYGGDRWTVRYGPADDEEAIMVVFEEHNIIGKVVGDPLAIKAFI